MWIAWKFTSKLELNLWEFNLLQLYEKFFFFFESPIQFPDTLG